MRKNKKVFLVGGNQYDDYLNWIIPLGFEITENLNEANLIFFCGGTDVGANLYGERFASRTGCDPERDKYESKIFHDSGRTPKIGVCRGGQFLTVMNGYKLVQHMSHPAYHNIETIDGKTIAATSSHHNQFLLTPNNVRPASEYKLLAWCKKMSPIHLGEHDEDYHFPADYKEPEIVAYKSKEYGDSLSIQMHPEWIGLENPTVKYCQNLLANMFGGKL